MMVYLVQYHDEHGGLQTQSVHIDAEAARDSVPVHMSKWGLLSDALFSIEAWDTKTGCYIGDVNIILKR